MQSNINTIVFMLYPPLSKVRPGEKKSAVRTGGVPWTRACLGQRGGYILNIRNIFVTYIHIKSHLALQRG